MFSATIYPSTDKREHRLLEFIMRRCQYVATVAVLILVVVSVGCTGFFVNPTLTSLAVGPSTPTIQQGNTLQMAATGTYDDGSTKALTGKVLWSSSDSAIASINSTGLMTGVSPGSATITASSGTISGSTSVTVSLQNITSITVTPANRTITQGSTVQYTATATTSDGNTHDITNSVTWTSSNTNAGTINSSGLFTAVTSVTTSQASIISASSGNISSPTSGSQAATVTVN